MRFWDKTGAALLLASSMAVAASVGVAEKDRELLSAVSQGQFVRVQALLKAGANVNLPHPPWQLTPLLVGSETDLAMVRLLVTHDADVNVHDRDGLTPLMKAIATRDPAIVALLLDAGADIDARDHRGHTALTHAVLRSHPEILKMLIGRGARLDVVTTMGTTPWSMAQEMRAAALAMPAHTHSMSHHHHAAPKSSNPAAEPPPHPMRSKPEALAQTRTVLDLLSAAGATRPQQTVNHFDAMEYHRHH